MALAELSTRLKTLMTNSTAGYIISKLHHVGNYVNHEGRSKGSIETSRQHSLLFYYVK